MGSNPSGVAITPDGTRAYVLNIFSEDVSVIDTDPVSANFNTKVATIGDLGDDPFGVAFTPDGAFAYVTTQGPATVWVIDTATNMVEDEIVLGDGVGTGVAFTPDGAFAYVGNAGSGLLDTVSVIDTSNMEVGPTITVGAFPMGIAITPNGAFAYVTNSDGTVSVLDTASNMVATIRVGTDPRGVAITPNGAFAYVTNLFSDDVSVIELESDPAQAIQNVIDELNAIINNNPGTPLADKIEAVRNSAQTALDELNKTGLVDKIALAEQALAAGDPLRTSGDFKDAVSKYKDALSEAEDALPPPDNQAVMGAIEGAVGDLETVIGLEPAVDPVLLDLMDQLAGVARQLAATAIDAANAGG